MSRGSGTASRESKNAPLLTDTVHPGTVKLRKYKKTMSHMFVKLYIHYRTLKLPTYSVILMPCYFSLFWCTIRCCALNIMVLMLHQNEEGRAKRHVSAAFHQFQIEKL